MLTHNETKNADQATKRDCLNLDTVIKKQILSYLHFYPDQIHALQLNRHWRLLTEYVYKEALQTYMPSVYGDLRLKLTAEKETKAIRDSLKRITTPAEETKSEIEQAVVPASVYRGAFLEEIDIKEEILFPDYLETLGALAGKEMHTKVINGTPVYVLMGALMTQQFLDSIYQSRRVYSTEERRQYDVKGDLAFATSLQFAILCRQLREVKRLLVEQKKDPNQATDKLKKPPYILAAETGQLGILKLLIEHDADTEATIEEEDEKLDAIHFAARNGHADVVKFLVSTCTIEKKNTLLVTAIQFRRLNVAEVLLESGADANVKVYKPGSSDDSLPAIFYALAFHQPELMKLLMEKGANLIIHSADDNPVSLMGCAINLNYLPIVKMLVEHKVDLSERYCENNTPLGFAVEKECLPIIKYLAEQKAENLASAFFPAIDKNNIEIVELLISLGLDVNQMGTHVRKFSLVRQGDGEHKGIASLDNFVKLIDTKDITPLEYAILSENRLDMVQCLWKHGAKVLTKEDKEIHPAVCAIEHNNLPVLEFLLKQDGINPSDFLITAIEKKGDDAFNLVMTHKPNVDVKDKMGNTALECAINHLDDELVFGNKLFALIKAGATYNPNDLLMDVVKKAGNRKYALRKSRELIQSCLEHKADVNQTDKDGKTPLMYVAEAGDLSNAKALIEAGAILESIDKNGEMALHKAVAARHNHVVDLILEQKPETALFNGIKYNCVLTVKKNLPPHGAGINSDDLNSLGLAIELDHREIVNILFQHGFIINGIVEAKKLFDKAPSVEIKQLILENQLEQISKGDDKPKQERKEEKTAEKPTAFFVSQLKKPAAFFEGISAKHYASQLLKMLHKKDADKILELQTTHSKDSQLIVLCDMAMEILQPQKLLTPVVLTHQHTPVLMPRA